MSGLTPLVDTLLATRLAQRVDLVPLKAQLEIAGPAAVTNVEQAGNDVRLPSREALQRQLGAGLASRDDGPLDFSPARQGGTVTLSVAARMVSALLNLPVGTTPAVRGRAPLQADMRSPVAPPVLTATLARTVAESGLFYESHLQHYAAGLRTLGQLAREPQGGMASPTARAPAPDVSLPLPVAAVSAVSPFAAAAALPGGGGALPFVRLPPRVPLDALGPDAQALQGRPSMPAGHPEPAGPATGYGRTGLPDHEVPSPHDFSTPDLGLQGTQRPEATPADAVRPGHAAAAAIHPDAVGLVRQQLELLATPVFRWSGEGWPGIPMDWEIRQERDGQEGGEGRADDGGPEAPPSVWSTRMTLKLPTLGTVDARLGLAGAALQLRLEASKDGTVAVLNQASAELLRRFGAAGLELTDLKIRGAASGAGVAADLTGDSNAG